MVGAEEAPVLLATVVVIMATLAQVLVLKLRRRKVDTMLWVSLVLVVVLGGADDLVPQRDLHQVEADPAVLGHGRRLPARAAAGGKNLLRLLLGEQLTLPEPVWQRLNWAWIAFFGAMGALNLWVAYSFPPPPGSTSSSSAASA